MTTKKHKPPTDYPRTLAGVLLLALDRWDIDGGIASPWAAGRCAAWTDVVQLITGFYPRDPRAREIAEDLARGQLR